MVNKYETYKFFDEKQRFVSQSSFPSPKISLTFYPIQIKFVEVLKIEVYLTFPIFAKINEVDSIQWQSKTN